MSLQNAEELDNTREELRALEEQYDAARARTTDNEQVRELTLRSLRALINQLKEEIARFESRQTARS